MKRQVASKFKANLGYTENLNTYIHTQKTYENKS